MKRLSARLGALVTVLGVSLVASPGHAVAGQQLTGSVTVQGDSQSPMDYVVMLVRADAGSGAGKVFHTATFTSDVSHLSGDFYVRFQLQMMDNAFRYYVAGDPDGSAHQADATLITLGGTDPCP